MYQGAFTRYSPGCCGTMPISRISRQRRKKTSLLILIGRRRAVAVPRNPSHIAAKMAAPTEAALLSVAMRKLKIQDLNVVVSG